MEQTLTLLVEDAMRRFNDQPAFAAKSADKKFHSISFRKLHRRVRSLAAALMDLGLRARENVALLADNRMEWITADLAVIFCGAADVPRGTDITGAEIRYILSHSDARFAFVENGDLLERIFAERAFLPALSTIIVLDPDFRVEAADGFDSADAPAVYEMNALIERGAALGSDAQTALDNRIAGIDPEDLFTLIYTSGTTGAPKGVQLTHRNMVSQIERNPFKISPKDRILSILPVWHIFERVFEMFAVINGCCTYYTNVRHLREDLSLVKPTFMASAPRLWESIYTGIMTNVGKAPPIRRALFTIAYNTTSRFKKAVRFLSSRELAVTPRSPLAALTRGGASLLTVFFLSLPVLLLDFLVLRKIRTATGGRLRGSVSGGGALPVHIDEFFNNVGIPVLEGYGLTETSPVLAVRTFENLVIGTVGPLYAGTEMRLVDIHTNETVYPAGSSCPAFGKVGEIHVRGPQVMKGYYKNPVATDNVLRDGWFNTGDLGLMTANRCLKIVGRSKDTIVLSSGENVEPVPIENRLLQSPLIDQCMIVGQDQKYLGALIVPARDPFGNAEYSVLADSPEAHAEIEKEIRRLVSADSGFKGFERVVAFALLPKPFQVGDELTAKLSMRRHVIAEKYKRIVESLYE